MPKQITSERQFFDQLIDSYINGNKDWVADKFIAMGEGQKDRFLDYCYSQIDHERAYSIFYSILKRIS